MFQVSGLDRSRWTRDLHRREHPQHAQQRPVGDGTLGHRLLQRAVDSGVSPCSCCHKAANEGPGCSHGEPPQNSPVAVAWPHSSPLAAHWQPTEREPRAQSPVSGNQRPSIDCPDQPGTPLLCALLSVCCLVLCCVVLCCAALLRCVVRASPRVQEQQPPASIASQHHASTTARRRTHPQQPDALQWPSWCPTSSSPRSCARPAASLRASLPMSPPPLSTTPPRLPPTPSP